MITPGLRRIAFSNDTFVDLFFFELVKVILSAVLLKKSHMSSGGLNTLSIDFDNIYMLEVYILINMGRTNDATTHF